jgi:uncharacterized protein (DUF4415 family)
MTARKEDLRNDLRKADEHTITPEEYAEIPELTDEWFQKAEFHKAGRPVRRGRPPAANKKRLVSLRLSPDVLEKFKATGPGWQTRIDAALKKASPEQVGRRSRAAIAEKTGAIGRSARAGAASAQRKGSRPKK